jgi:hypothetical protein
VQLLKLPPTPRLILWFNNTKLGDGTIVKDIPGLTSGSTIEIREHIPDTRFVDHDRSYFILGS